MISSEPEKDSSENIELDRGGPTLSLVCMRELLDDARKRNYAIGGFNVFNFETLGAVIEVGEELKTPLVLGVPERLFKFVDAELLSAAMVKAATKASIPVALHLDHGHTYEGIMRAIRWGFTSIMFDGSSLPFEENMKRSREITKMAHALGITVEGELANLTSDAVPGTEEAFHAAREQAIAFVEKSKIDALAVAFHGGSRCSDMAFGQIGQLSKAVQVPLVMHGGTKLKKDDYQTAIQAGVAKINIATDMSLAAADKLKGELALNPTANYIHLMSVVKKGVKESVRKYMLNFDCISKAP